MVNLSPIPQNQRVLRYNSEEEAEVEENDDANDEDFSEDDGITDDSSS